MSAEFPRMFLCNRLNQGKSSHAISFVPWLLTHSLNSSGHVTLNASCSIQRQYILFNEQRTHDWEDMHAIAYPNLIYKNNQIRKMEYTQSDINTYSITHKLKMSMSAWSPFVLSQRHKQLFLYYHEPRAIYLI